MGVGLRAFKGVAAATGQPQILFNCRAASRLGDEMIEFHGHAKQCSATEAVATAVLGVLPHTAGNGGWNATATGRGHVRGAASLLSSASVGTRLPRKRSRTAARALRNITRSACCCKMANCSRSESESVPS